MAGRPSKQRQVWLATLWILRAVIATGYAANLCEWWFVFLVLRVATPTQPQLVARLTLAGTAADVTKSCFIDDAPLTLSSTTCDVSLLTRREGHLSHSSTRPERLKGGRSNAKASPHYCTHACGQSSARMPSLERKSRAHTPRSRESPRKALLCSILGTPTCGQSRARTPSLKARNNSPLAVLWRQHGAMCV